MQSTAVGAAGVSGKDAVSRVELESRKGFGAVTRRVLGLAVVDVAATSLRDVRVNLLTAQASSTFHSVTV